MSEQETAAEKALPKMPSSVKLNFEIPTVKEFLKTGAQFGHPTKRWNPKMSKYIFSKRGDIHIIDLSQTLPMLEDALKFLVNASATGRILYVGTKQQASDIMKSEAKRAGAYYVSHRWPGGLFTNFNMIKKSLKQLQSLEEKFESGVEGRTKFEVSRMKKEWERLNRLYQGVKTMDRKPKAIVVVDPNFEKNAVREAKAVGVPIIAVVDTNSDPEGINYPIPANDDAVKSLRMFIGLMSEAVLQGNGGRGVVHQEKDYSKTEVKIIKEETPEVEEEMPDAVEVTEVTKEVVETEIVKSSAKLADDEKKGLLGRSREQGRKIKIKTVEAHEEKKEKTEKAEKPAAKKEPKKKETKKTSTKTAKKPAKKTKK